MVPVNLIILFAGKCNIKELLVQVIIKLLTIHRLVWLLVLRYL